MLQTGENKEELEKLLNHYLTAEQELKKIAAELRLNPIEFKIITRLGLEGITTPENAIIMTELSHDSETSQSHASRVLEKFRKEGLIGVALRESERRCRWVYLSEKGQDLYQRTLELLEQQNKEKET